MRRAPKLYSCFCESLSLNDTINDGSPGELKCVIVLTPARSNIALTRNRWTRVYALNIEIGSPVDDLTSTHRPLAAALRSSRLSAGVSG